MEPNPYEAPRVECPAEPPATVPERTVRHGVPIVIAIAWNLPLLVILGLGIAGALGRDAFYGTVAAWSLVIPITSVTLMFCRPLQRLVFVEGIDMAKTRSRLWGLSCLWLAILGVWLAARFAFGA